jgi:glycosyltransferase involved in cell wall biosynthesis
MANKTDFSVVLPCRNEEKTIEKCIKKINKVFEKFKLKGEIIVSDSSADKSPKIAKKLGAKVVKHNKVGYGVAILEGLKEAKGKYIIIADADNTYDFYEMPKFLSALDEGYDLVVGSRYKGKIKKGAMPFLHKYIGNPLLSLIFKTFFRTKLSDIHSGFRAIRKDVLDKLNLKTTGMEFASEMILAAEKNNLKIKEVPISYHPREGETKLQSFKDGWRHLRFMLMYSPTYLFLIPGFSFLLIGLLIVFSLLGGPKQLFGFNFDIHFMFLGSLLALLGYQIISIGLYAKTYAINIGFEKHDRIIDFIAKYISLERGLLLGFIIFLIGFIPGFRILYYWISHGFSALDETRFLIFTFTFLLIGIQTMFSVFFISLMLIEKK